jgi:hypothetical protein
MNRGKAVNVHDALVPHDVVAMIEPTDTLVKSDSPKMPTVSRAIATQIPESNKANKKIINIKEDSNGSMRH